jgi:hypothetical protein
MALIASACDCDNIPVALTEIPVVTCPFKIGQMLRFWFVRAGEVIFDSVTPASNLPATITGDLINEAAPWAVLFAAVNSTKVIKTPIVGGNPTITAGTANIFGGGGNDTANGLVLNLGVNPSDVSMDFFFLTKEQIIAIRKLECEDVEVYIINNEGKIFFWEDENGLQTGIPVLNLQLLDKSNGGVVTPDVNTLSFKFPARYDEKLTSVNPEAGFNTLTV